MHRQPSEFLENDDTDEAYKHFYKTTFTIFKACSNFDCLAFRKQTIKYTKTMLLLFCALVFVTKIHLYPTF